MALQTVYWTVTGTIGLDVYADTTYFPANGAEKIGKYSGSTTFKGIDVADSKTSDEIIKKTTETQGNQTYEIEWAYNPSAKGYQVYRMRPVQEDGSTGAWMDNMYWARSAQNGMDYNISGTYTATSNVSTTADANDSSSGASYSDMEASEGYHPDIESITTFDKIWENETNGEEYFSVVNILGVFGIPYQFMPHVDPRLRYRDGGSVVAGTSSYLTDTQGTGLEYADHIASHMPILFLSPGVPNFMTKFSPEEKQSILDYTAQSIAGIAGVFTPEELVKDSGKYYTFEYAVPQYYQYVNPMCRIASAYMNVAHYTWDNVRMDAVNWMDYTTAKLDAIFQGRADITDYLSIPFYLESETQINESFSNDTTESSIMSSIDSISDIGREAMFVLGYSQSALLEKPLIGVSGDANEAVNSFMNQWGHVVGNNSFLKKLVTNIASVATGGRLVFPKIWSDSSFSRSYDVTIKLRSPDMDNLSIYLNVIVPFLHLMGFVLPRQLDKNPNGYASPFLVRAIYKGFFNIDMGIITSMSVTKGDQSQWNAEGIPTAIDVNLTIADLYENISMTPTTTTNWAYDTMDNTCQMDYIATMCGINIYQPEVGRTIRMWLTNNFTNRARDFIDIGVWGNIQNSIANAIVNVWRGKSL